MAGSVNKVILLGNLGQDPVVRTSQDGNKIVQLSIATSERWKDRMSGEQRERTEWHRVVIFNEGLSNNDNLSTNNVSENLDQNDQNSLPAKEIEPPMGGAGDLDDEIPF